MELLRKRDNPEYKVTLTSSFHWSEICFNYGIFGSSVGSGI